MVVLVLLAGCGQRAGGTPRRTPLPVAQQEALLAGVRDRLAVLPGVRCAAVVEGGFGAPGRHLDQVVLSLTTAGLAPEQRGDLLRQAAREVWRSGADVAEISGQVRDAATGATVQVRDALPPTRARRSRSGRPG